MIDTQRLKIKDLRAFEAVAREGGIGRGAEALFLSQPAVTHCIKNIENYTDSVLFVRNAKGVYPTDAGTILLRRVRRYFTHLRTGFAALKTRDDAGCSPWVANCIKRLSDRHMRCLIAVSDSETFAVAAQKLDLSEASLSQAAKELVALTGDIALFKRTRSGTVCSDKGRELARRFKLAHMETAFALQELAEARGIAQTQVRIGALPLAGTQLLGQTISAFCAQHPQVRFVLLQDLYEALLGKLRSGELDFIVGVVRNQVLFNDVIEEPLLVDPYVVAARVDHPLVAHPDISISDLMDWRWILPSQDSPRRLAFQNIADQSEVHPVIDVETSSLRHTRSILLQTDKLSLLTDSELKVEVEAGILARLPFEVPGESRVVGITTMVDHLATERQMEFLTSLRSLASELNGGRLL